MPTPFDRKTLPARGRPIGAPLIVGLSARVASWGCGGEPSRREVDNARAFEALLTAVSLKNEQQLERDARTIDERHASGELSDGKYRELGEIIGRARAKDWAGAEKRAYEFRAQFGDRGSFFK